MPLLFDDNKLFSIQLKDARKNMNLTQAKCAEYLNISTTFYKELERNQSSPSLELYYTGAIRPITADRLNAHSTAILRGLKGRRKR